MIAVSILLAQTAQTSPAAKPGDVFRMIRSNDWDALQSVAAKPGIAHLHDGLGATPLRFMLAVASDDAKPANVRQLITAGADVNSVDVYGDSVLD